MRRRHAVSLGAQHSFGAVAVPGGVAGLGVTTRDYASLYFFAWRNARLHQTWLRAPTGHVVLDATLAVHWPTLLVSADVACVFVSPCPADWPNPAPSLGPLGTVVFESRDGGENWTTHPPAAQTAPL